jgi:CheY-like chemotaxis protein
MFSYRESDPSPSPVLIVDDRWEDNFLLQRLLRVAKIRNPVITAGGGAEAMDLVEHCLRDGRPALPCLIYVDLNMPDKNGFDVLQWVREHSALNEVAVVMLAGSDSPADAARAYELGAQSYLVKYPSSQTLAEIVELASLPVSLRGSFPRFMPDDGGSQPGNRRILP